MLEAAFEQLSGLVIPGGHCGFHTTTVRAGAAAESTVLYSLPYNPPYSPAQNRRR
jgi:hypothetical protein